MREPIRHNQALLGLCATLRRARAIPTTGLPIVLAGLWILLGAGVAPGDEDNGLGKEFDYDLSKFERTDPKLVLYKETGQIKAGLKSLHGVAVDAEDRVHITGDSVLARFDRSGKRNLTVQLDGAATCVAVGKDGAIYLGVGDHVEVYDGEGTQKAVWTSLSEKAILTSIAVGEKDVFVADAGDRLVLRFDPSGRLINMIGMKDKSRNAPGFLIPSPYFDVALGAKGDLWVVDPGRCLVANYSVKGERKSYWGKTSLEIDGFCGCCNPTHIAIQPDGSFVTSEKGLPRVKIYSADGRFVGVVAGPEHFGEKTVGLDLAVDSHGRILVLDPKAGVVRIFEKKHRTVE